MLKRLGLFFLAIIVIIEEWLWDILAYVGQWLSQLLRLHRFDEWLMGLSAVNALLAFSIPIIILMPFNLFAVYLLTHGAVLQGILLEIILKLIGTLFIARIFRLVKPALLTIQWFAKIYQAITSLLHWAHESVRQLILYQRLRQLKTAIKQRINQLWSR